MYVKRSHPLLYTVQILIKYALHQCYPHLFCHFFNTSSLDTNDRRQFCPDYVVRLPLFSGGPPQFQPPGSGPGPVAGAPGGGPGGPMRGPPPRPPGGGIPPPGGKY